VTTLVTADLHLSANPRDEYRFHFLEQRIPTLLKGGEVSRLLVLGDLTETKDGHDADFVNRVATGFRRIADFVEVDVVMGNHDYMNGHTPFFRILGLHPKITFIEEPKLVGKTLYLPHTRNPAKDWPKSMDRVTKIFTHYTFEGAISESGTKLEGMSLEELPDVPIYSGDVHVPQRISNLTYIGAPYTIDFGDAYIGRVLMFNGEKVKEIIVGGPQKRLLRAPHLTGANAGDVVRIEVPIKASEYPKWQEKSDQLRAWADENKLTVEAIVPVITERKTSKEMPTRKATVSDEQLLEDYGKTKKLDERTLARGKDLL
jgi:hypothetical protein